MGKKLTKEQAEKKVKFHEKRAVYYTNKISEIEKDSKVIGFKF